MSKKRGRVQKLTHKDKAKRKARNARRHRAAAIWEHHTVVPIKKRLDPISAIRARREAERERKIAAAQAEMDKLEDES